MRLRYLRARAARPAFRRSDFCEPLEARTLFTTLVVTGTPGNDNITLGIFHWAQPFFADGISVTLNGVTTNYPPNLWTAVQINNGAGNDTINVLGTLVPTSVMGGGPDVVNVGDSTGVQNIRQSLNVSNPPSTTNLTINDAPDAGGHSAIIGAGQVSGLAPAVISYNPTQISSLQVNGGSGGNNFTISHTIPGIVTNVLSGTGVDVVNVTATTATGTLNVNGQNGADTVYVGDIDGVQSIAGPVNISNSLSGSILYIDDAHDTTARGATITDTAVLNLAPAAIGYANLAELTVDGGSGGNTWFVGGTIANIPTILNAGTANDTATIGATAAGGTFGFNGEGGTDAVTVGFQGTVQPIAGTVSISSTVSNSTSVLVDDSADTTARNATLASTVLPTLPPNWGILTGLAPASIEFQYARISSFGVTLGPASNSLNIRATQVPTNVSGGGHIMIRPFPLPPIIVGGDDTINIGDGGSAQNIAGVITIANPWGQNTINVNDGADSARIAVLDNVSLGTLDPYGTITGLAPAAIDYDYRHSAALNITSGPGANTFNIHATGTSTTITSGGADHVNVSSAGSVQGIGGNLTLENLASHTVLTVDDSADPTARTVTLGTAPPAGDADPFDTLSGLAPAVITFESNDMASPVVIDGGSGGNAFNVAGTAPAHTGGSGGANIQLNTGSGNDTVTFTGTSAGTTFTVNGQDGNDQVNVDYSGGHVIAGNITFQGGTGGNLLAITGAGATDTLGVTFPQIAHGSQAVLYANILGLTLSQGVFNVTQNLTGKDLTATGGGTHVNFTVGQDLSALSIGRGAAVVLTHSTSRLGKLLTTRSFGIGAASTLDLANNELRWSYASPSGTLSAATIRMDLSTRALISSDAAANVGYALGYADSADTAVAGLGLPTHIIDVRYTRQGDADLNGTVNFADLLLLVQNYGNSTGSAVWDMGDSNYDGNADFADLLLLVQNYGLPAASTQGRQSAGTWQRLRASFRP